MKNFTIIAQQELVLVNKPSSINQIIVEASGGDGNYTYYFNDIKQNDGIIYINRNENYIIKVVDGKGCEAIITGTIDFIDIVIPNFFTPDGDGKNDTWVIKNANGFPNMTVVIFDRWGRQIKKFTGTGEWDGNYDDILLPTGDYWYIIKLNGETDTKEFVGNFTLYK